MTLNSLSPFDFLLNNTPLIDISPPLSPNTAVWPGDVPLSRKMALEMKRGDNLTLSSLQATVHLGAHADAPSHYTKDGLDIAHVDLRAYMGTCQIITIDPRKLTHPEKRILWEDITQDICAPRILFRTNSFVHTQPFREDFVSLSPELIGNLAQRDVLLVGIDTPSVDPFADPALKTHQQIASTGMRILEGLDLEEVPIANVLYTLVALPLRLEGFDASPVRAVLIPHDPQQKGDSSL